MMRARGTGMLLEKAMVTGVSVRTPNWTTRIEGCLVCLRRPCWARPGQLSRADVRAAGGRSVIPEGLYAAVWRDLDFDQKQPCVVLNPGHPRFEAIARRDVRATDDAK